MIPRMHLHVIYASTSGHVEYVVQVLAEYLKNVKTPRSQGSKTNITMVRVEKATEKDLKKGDLLVLASSTWNTGGIEGQLNPHMHDYLKKAVQGSDLKGKPVALVGLGDKRYRYTVRAADHLEAFVASHKGKHIGKTLRIVNEPYGQEGKIRAWGEKLLHHLQAKKLRS